jgi:hypothetical protein
MLWHLTRIPSTERPRVISVRAQVRGWDIHAVRIKLAWAAGLGYGCETDGGDITSGVIRAMEREQAGCLTVRACLGASQSGPAWGIARNAGVWGDCCKAILQKLQR